MPELGAMRIIGVRQVRVTDHVQEYNNCLYIELIGDDSCTIEVARDYMDGDGLPELLIGDAPDDPFAGEMEYESWLENLPAKPSVLLAERDALLDNLKRRYADRNDGGRMNDWKLIRRCDPDWENPWTAEPEIESREHAQTFYDEGANAEKSAKNPYPTGCIAANLWHCGRLGYVIKDALDIHYGKEK